MISYSSTIWYKNIIDSLNGELVNISEKEIRWLIGLVLENLNETSLIMDKLEEEEEEESEMLAVWESDIYHSLLISSKTSTTIDDMMSIFNDIDDNFDDDDDNERLLNDNITNYNKKEDYHLTINNINNHNNHNRKNSKKDGYQKYIKDPYAMEWISNMQYINSKQFILDDQTYWIPWKDKFNPFYYLISPLFTRQHKLSNPFKPWNLSDKTKYFPMLDIPSIKMKYENHLLSFIKESKLTIQEKMKNSLLELDQHFHIDQIIEKINDPINLYIPLYELKPRTITKKLSHLTTSDRSVPQQMISQSTASTMPLLSQCQTTNDYSPIESFSSSFKTNPRLSIPSSSESGSESSSLFYNLGKKNESTSKFINTYSNKKKTTIATTTATITNNNNSNINNNNNMVNKDMIYNNHFTFISPPPPSSTSIPLMTTANKKSQYWLSKKEKENNNNRNDQYKKRTSSIPSSSSIISLSSPLLSSSSSSSPSSLEKNKNLNRSFSDISNLSIQSPHSILENHHHQISTTTSKRINIDEDEDEDDLSIDSILLRYIVDHDETNENSKKKNPISPSSLPFIDSPQLYDVPDFNITSESNTSPSLPQVK
ncbi:unnamed protein product [Cunninghamella blakesleeana]